MEKSIKDNSVPLVSVLIGTYNRADLINRCIDSILNQSYKSIEIIIVDDASTDNTISVLEKYVNKYPNKIKFISNETNKGISYNSNLAYSQSKGQYLALVGDDDEWHDQEKISMQIKAFKENKKLGIVSTYWNDVKNEQIVNHHKPIINTDPLCQILKGNGVYCGSTVLVSKIAWDSVNGFDEKVIRGTDSELFRSIIMNGFKTHIIPVSSTNVFIDDHFRMTPVNSYESQIKAINANIYLLKKYFFIYLKKPSALFVRLLNTIKLICRLMKIKILKK